MKNLQLFISLVFFQVFQVFFTSPVEYKRAIWRLFTTEFKLQNG